MPEQGSRRAAPLFVQDARWVVPPPGTRAAYLDPRRAALRTLLPLLGEGTVSALRVALARQWLDVEAPPDPAEAALVLGELSNDLARRCREAPADELAVVEEGGKPCPE